MAPPQKFGFRDSTELEGFVFLSFREILAMKGPFNTRQEREKARGGKPIQPYSSTDYNGTGRPILVLFCSHIWETEHHPDPDQSQLNSLKHFIRALQSLYTTMCDDPTTVDGFETMAKESEDLCRHGWIQAALLLGDMLTSSTGVVNLQLHIDASQFLDRCFIWYDYADRYTHSHTR